MHVGVSRQWSTTSAGFDQSGRRYSLLEYVLKETETLHAKLRRFTSPDEHAFFPGVCCNPTSCTPQVVALQIGALQIGALQIGRAGLLDSAERHIPKYGAVFLVSWVSNFPKCCAKLCFPTQSGHARGIHTCQKMCPPCASWVHVMDAKH